MLELMTPNKIQTVILMGPPGAGKGVQSQLLAAAWSAIHLSSGELLRQAANPRVVSIMNHGLSAPSDDFKAIMRRAVLALPKDRSVVFESVTIVPGEVPWLLDLLREIGRSLDHVIVLEVDESITNDRASVRGRHDDAKQIERWRRYREETLQSIELYRQLGLVIEVDGSGTIAEVAARIQAVLNPS